MKCNDCIYEKMCEARYEREHCFSFKDKANFVEVVRCKDCKHHPDNSGECDRSITHTSRDYVCEVNTYRYIGLDYCSYGERSKE